MFYSMFALRHVNTKEWISMQGRTQCSTSKDSSLCFSGYLFLQYTPKSQWLHFYLEANTSYLLNMTIFRWRNIVHSTQLPTNHKRWLQSTTLLSSSLMKPEVNSQSLLRVVVTRMQERVSFCEYKVPCHFGTHKFKFCLPDSKPCKKRNTTKEKRNNLSSMLSWLFTVKSLSFDDCSLLGVHLLKRPVVALSIKKLSVITIFSSEDFSIFCWPTKRIFWPWLGWLLAYQKSEMIFF